MNFRRHHFPADRKPFLTLTPCFSHDALDLLHRCAIPAILKTSDSLVASHPSSLMFLRQGQRFFGKQSRKLLTLASIMSVSSLTTVAPPYGRVLWKNFPLSGIRPLVGCARRVIALRLQQIGREEIPTYNRQSRKSRTHAGHRDPFIAASATTFLRNPRSF